MQREAALIRDCRGKEPRRRARLARGHELRGPAGVAGFTLVELVLVLTLLVVLSALAGPRFFERRVFDERLFADGVADALRYAQKVAVASGCSVEVTVSASGYALKQREACAGPSFSRAVPHPGRVGSSYAAAPPPATPLASSISPFRFDALGRALDASGAPSDVLIRIGGRSLRVHGATGLVQ
jgi:MSHA pilin protein MshC